MCYRERTGRHCGLKKIARREMSGNRFVPRLRTEGAADKPLSTPPGRYRIIVSSRTFHVSLLSFAASPPRIKSSFHNDRLIASQTAFDQTVRLLRRPKNGIVVRLAESRHVDRYAMNVRQRERDLGNGRMTIEDCLAHCVEGMLHGQAVVLGKGIEYRPADAIP